MSESSVGGLVRYTTTRSCSSEPARANVEVIMVVDHISNLWTGASVKVGKASVEIAVFDEVSVRLLEQLKVVCSASWTAYLPDYFTSTCCVDVIEARLTKSAVMSVGQRRGLYPIESSWKRLPRLQI